jgi:hypothetical protein
VKCLIKEFPNKYLDIAAKETPDSEEEGTDWVFRLQTLYILEVKLFGNAPSVLTCIPQLRLPRRWHQAYASFSVA